MKRERAIKLLDALCDLIRAQMDEENNRESLSAQRQLSEASDTIVDLLERWLV